MFLYQIDLIEWDVFFLILIIFCLLRFGAFCFVAQLDGRYGGHWNGDNTAKFKHLQVSIPLLFAFNMFGIPMVGSDICGFIDDTTLELCARWMQVGAFYPFSRNHNTYYTIPQDPPALGEPVLSISRNILNVRYSLLPNLYTLFYQSNIGESMVIYPLFFDWYFINETLNIEHQFLWGHFLLISPVVEENVTNINVLFPLISKNKSDSSIDDDDENDNCYYERWYDYFSFNEIIFDDLNYDLLNSGYEYKNIFTPLSSINIHIRGGSILTLQNPNGKLTTYDARFNPFELIIGLDCDYTANGFVYLDDGVTIDTTQYTYVEFVVTDTGDENVGDSVASVGDYLERSLDSTIIYGNFNMENNGTISEIRILGVGSSDTNGTARHMEDFIGSVSVNFEEISYNTSQDLFEWYYNTSDISLTISKLNLNISQSFNVKWTLKSNGESGSGGGNNKNWFQENVGVFFVFLFYVFWTMST